MVLSPTTSTVIPGVLCQGGDGTHRNDTGHKKSEDETILKHVGSGFLSWQKTRQIQMGPRISVARPVMSVVFRKREDGPDIIETVKHVGSRKGKTSKSGQC